MTYDCDGIRALLSAGQFDSLVGIHETVEIEFKGQPYRLGESHGKYELAKDVSALANARGGAIIVGVRTERSDSHPSDVAREVRPVPRQLVDQRQHEDVIRSWIFPPPEGCAVELFRDPRSSEAVLGFIKVPTQRPSIGPFVVSRVVEDESGRVQGATLALFERRTAGSPPLSPHEVQSLLRDGKLFRRAIDERSSLPLEEPQIPDARPAPKSGTISLSDRTRDRAAALIDLTDLAAAPTLVFAATPRPDVDASQMFASEDDPVTLALVHPPEIRAMGFDLTTHQHPDIVRGLSRRSLLRSYKALELWRDGTLVFVATAGEEFLCWGERAPNEQLRVHPVALIEATYLFCKLASTLFAIPRLQPREVAYTVHLRRMCIGSQPPLLAPGPRRPRMTRDYRPGPGCEADWFLEDSPLADPASVAFDLVKQVYAWFGHTYDRIPYVTDCRIDVDAIRQL